MATVQTTPHIASKWPSHKVKRMGQMLIGTIVIIAIAWGGWVKLHPAEDPLTGMITAKVTRGNLVETVSATGSINAQTGAQVKIGSQVTGRIKKLNADVGSLVTAGQIIAELDLPDVQAQLNQAKDNLAIARVKQAQLLSGVQMQRTQIANAIVQANAGRNGAIAKLHSAQAAAKQQSAQTPTDIQRAVNGVAGATAALSTAHSNMVQTQAGAELQIANSQQQVNQAQATALNSGSDLKRQQALLEKGYVAASLVEKAQATDTVNKSQIISAQQNLTLVKQKITADLQAGKDQITQAEQNVKTSQSALVSAQAGKYLDTVKQADVGNARASLTQGDADLAIANGNAAQNGLKQQDILQSQAAVRASQEQVAVAQAQMDKTSIRSPISGTVLQMAAQQGETLAAGLSSPTVIVVADLKRLQVDAYVDETDIGKVQIAQGVNVTVDAFSNQHLTGRVTKIASGSTIQSGVITYDVTVTLDNHELVLKPDMTASVTIETGKQTGVLLVPSEGIKTGTDGLAVNVVANKNGKSSIEKRTVTTGGTDGVNTEILTGLKEGEIIILAGQSAGTDDKKSGSPFGMGGKGGGGGPPR